LLRCAMIPPPVEPTRLIKPESDCIKWDGCGVSDSCL
jgi:hypothetical protein